MTEQIRTGTGLIHLYTGDGKGKTTTGMGLCVRAAGYGYKVLIYQFMKNNSTSERSAMKYIPGITFIDGLEQEKFSFLLTPEEKAQRRDFYNRQLQKVTQIARDEEYDVLFLDEAEAGSDPYRAESGAAALRDLRLSFADLQGEASV